MRLRGHRGVCHGGGLASGVPGAAAAEERRRASDGARTWDPFGVGHELIQTLNFRKLWLAGPKMV